LAQSIFHFLWNFQHFMCLSMHILKNNIYLCTLLWLVPLAQGLRHSQLMFPSKTWFFGIYLNNQNHFKFNISHILNPNLTK
jgi:hypothetical protein